MFTKVNQKLTQQLKGKQKRKETTHQFVDPVEACINERLADIWTRKTWTEDPEMQSLGEGSQAPVKPAVPLEQPFYFDHELKAMSESHLIPQYNNQAKKVACGLCLPCYR